MHLSTTPETEEKRARLASSKWQRGQAEDTFTPLQDDTYTSNQETSSGEEEKYLPPCRHMLKRQSSIKQSTPSITQRVFTSPPQESTVKPQKVVSTKKRGQRKSAPAPTLPAASDGWRNREEEDATKSTPFCAGKRTRTCSGKDGVLDSLAVVSTIFQQNNCKYYH
ncbi:hypothetical protein AMECASPLE_038453 [Ameca splendens]|uniref:Uncharacterized protein n=1 Tax=Ameca splendens TaxID=208324 RepID=A0ABV0Z634_9TELE